jgi:N-acetylmuramic acid 6-phosphate etherase
VLLKQLDTADAQRIGLSAQDSIESRLKSFASVQRAVAASAPTLAEWTTREAEAYRNGHHATYLAQKTLMPVFVDVTERAPTFRLAPLDRIDTTPARSWIRVWAPVATPGEAWQPCCTARSRGWTCRPTRMPSNTASPTRPCARRPCAA